MSARFHALFAIGCLAAALVGMLSGVSDARVGVGLICCVVNASTASILWALEDQRQG